MTSYLVTNTTNNVTTWIPAISAHAALIIHENRLRAGRGLLPLSIQSKASHYSAGQVVDVSIGNSAVRGLRCNVERIAA